LIIKTPSRLTKRGSPS